MVIIAETDRNSQRLDACSALRQVGCGFFVASFASFGGFLCSCGSFAESPPL